MGSISKSWDLDPVRHPRDYGYLVTVMTAVPDFLAAPFFLAGGFYLRSIKRQKLVKGEITKDKLEENR